MQNDTIVGIATGMAGGGVGIIRVSGKDAVSIVDKICRLQSGKSLKNCKSHRILYGFIYDGQNPVDEVIILNMRAPKSYTKEDVVEIQCHGGSLVLKKIMELMIRNGARLAEPGEFTKRAFLNGRIDLSQAEAVMDIIAAKNEHALKHSLRQLRGSISEKIQMIRNSILTDVAFIEAALDDPEHYEIDGFGEELGVRVNGHLKELEKLLESFDSGRRLTEGIKTVILGRPNAGKSSLLNLLLGEERAIVTDIAGTTRDSLEETAVIGDITLNLIDTAGIRETDNPIEKIGVGMAKKYAESADLILYIIDGSIPFSEEDASLLDWIHDKEYIILVNKSDASFVIDMEALKKRTDKKIIPFSALQGDGMRELENTIKDKFFHGDISFDSEVYLTNVRHKEAIAHAVNSLKKVQDSIANQMPEDFYSIDLMGAYESLGKIIGETIEDDLADKIFREFCMGK